MMNELKVCANLYFDPLAKLNKSKELISELIALCNETIPAKNLDRIEWSTFEKGKKKNRSLKFNQKSLVNFIEGWLDGSIVSFDFTAINTEKEYIIWDTRASLQYLCGSQGYPSSLSLSFELTNTMSQTYVRQIFENLLVALINAGVTPDYGFAFLLESNKVPELFIAGIQTDYLTSEDRFYCELWGKHNKMYGSQIWDVFCLNVISKNHLVDHKMLNDIKEIVGSNNLRDFGNDVHLFQMPFGFLSHSKIRKTSSEYELMKSLFRKRGLLVEQYTEASTSEKQTLN